MATNYAQQFKQQIATAPTEEPLVEATFGRFKGLFRRLPIQAWVTAGRLPYFFIEELQDAADLAKDRPIEQVEEELEQRRRSEQKLTKERYEAGIKAQREIVMAACVNPKIVDHDGALAEDEIRYADLAINAPEAVGLIVGWALQGSPNIPVSKWNGLEVSVADVSSFRNGKRGAATSGPGAQISDVRRASAKRRTRHKG